MTRRATTANKAGKARRRNIKRRQTTHLASAATLRKQLRKRTHQLAVLRNKLSESLAQQNAAAAVLKAISSSPGELKPIFEAILENATVICGAEFGTLYLSEGDAMRAAAFHNAPRAFVEERTRGPIRPSPKSTLGRAAQTKQIAQVLDATKHDPYRQRDPFVTGGVDLGGYRTIVSVPMLKGDKLIGIITIYRQVVEPFTDKQIELVQNFATQAVIAIENTRLLNELRQRTDDLSESLEQQTATSEVLKVISSFPGELEPVFQAILHNATRLCDAEFGSLFEFDNGMPQPMAAFNVPPPVTEFLRHGGHKVMPQNAFRRMIASRQPMHIADYSVDEAYLSGDPMAVCGVELGGIRSLLIVPLLKDDEIVGAFGIFRQEVRPFSSKQVELVANFAAQAVIAIENTRLLNELRQRTEDLSEALEQQTATSEVLKVVSSSPGDLQPVFEAMLENATRICRANYGVMHRYEDGRFRSIAMHNVPQALADKLTRRGTFLAPKGSPLDRLLETGSLVQTADEAGEAAPGVAARLGGARSLVAVPMWKESTLVGVLIIYRQEVRPFTVKQIELVQNFAAQAVIAIENTRLLNELRHRTDDLSEALEQQTASSEVLDVISNSLVDTQPVFDAIVRSGLRLFADAAIVIMLPQGDQAVIGAIADSDPVRAEGLRRRSPIPLRREYMHSLAIIDGKTVDVPDVNNPPLDLKSGAQNFRAGGFNAVTIVPMMRSGAAIGALSVARVAAGPLSPKQHSLLETFAAQAVIAIENTRLLSELRRRTDDLTESLEYQTATGEILGVISKSPTQVQPVFDIIAASALQLCDATWSAVLRFDGETIELAALNNLADFEGADAMRRAFPRKPSRTGATDQAISTRNPCYIPDIQKVSGYDHPTLAPFSRSVLSVPMLRDGQAVGAISVASGVPDAFSERQMMLLRTFADQAVIAIENVRLFDEVQKRTEDLSESLAQQTATADVLKTISRSTFDLKTVLNTLVESAARLSESDFATLNRQFDDGYRQVASYGVPAETAQIIEARPLSAGRGSVVGRTLLERRPVQIVDVLADPEFKMVDAATRMGANTILGIPLLREGIPIGVMTLQRRAKRAYSDKQIELLTTFADQAVIAIENVRLFESVEARTRELAQSLQDLQTAQDRLVQTQKLASLGQLTAGIAHEIKNPLNFVNNFSSLSTELLDELHETLQRVQSDEKTRSEITELTDTLRANLDKIEQHGRRADSIVKNMLLHSREGSGEHRPVDVNALVEESLNLAYHGARAEKQDFNITLERSFDPAAGEVDVFPQEITRVLLNLISNGFYAAIKRKSQTPSHGYEPTLATSTKNLGDSIEIRIRDNGTGIPAEVKDKMFNPFFTTKPPGEGTGLGLSISYDIIVKQHGGSIEVDSQPGEFAEFRIILPRTAASFGGRA
jgi:GAF domain-containing protein